jgi:hypothetical protein
MPKTILKLIIVMIVGIGCAIALGGSLFMVTARRPQYPLLQSKPTPIAPLPTPNLNATPIVVTPIVVAAWAVSPLPTPSPTRIPDYTPPVTRLELFGEDNGYNCIAHLLQRVL